MSRDLNDHEDRRDQTADQTRDQSNQRAGPHSVSLASGEQADHKKRDQPYENIKDRLERSRGELRDDDLDHAQHDSTDRSPFPDERGAYLARNPLFVHMNSFPPCILQDAIACITYCYVPSVEESTAKKPGCLPS